MIKLENIVRTIKKHPRKTLASLILAGLIAVTSLKDNVHFGSVTLNNPTKNHYVWGIAPATKVYGREAKGNIRTFGLFGGINKLGDNSSITGDMGAYGLAGGINDLGDNSTITGDMGAYSLLVGNNSLGDNSSIKGNSTSRGIFLSGPRGDLGLGVNTEIDMNYTHHKKQKE